jgi:CspA family cold shock protein
MFQFVSVAIPADAFKPSERKAMASGKVKWFDNKHGFGFIVQDAGPDVFVHHTAILGTGYKTLKEGEEVVFEIVAGEKGPKAQNVQRQQASS